MLRFSGQARGMLSTTIHAEAKGAGGSDSKGHTKFRLLSTDQSNAVINPPLSGRASVNGSTAFQLRACEKAVEQPSNRLKPNTRNHEETMA